MNEVLMKLILTTILLAITLLLMGCSSIRQDALVCKPINIDVPKESTYPVYNLKKGDKPDVVMKSYVATVKGQRNYIDQLKYLIGKEK